MKHQEYEYERIEIPNSSVLDSAEQFYDGANILRRLPPLSGVLLPMITNAALAMELYIKSLSVRSIIKNYESFGNGVYGGRVTELPLKEGHDLSVLLENISDEVKLNIDNLYEDGVIQYSFLELVLLVKPYDKLFIQVRYSYENDALSDLNITEFFDCLNVIRNVISKIDRIHRVKV